MRSIGLLFVALSVCTGHAAEKPNIIVILADDMGYGDCSTYNPESKILTPNIDRLASEGMLFTDAHSASTTCTASRYGLLTGITPARRGIVNGINGLGPVLEAKELTLAEMLKAQGYSTRMIGKWHLGFELTSSEGRRPILDLSKPFVGGPLDHGFDSFLGMNSAMTFSSAEGHDVQTSCQRSGVFAPNHALPSEPPSRLNVAIVLRYASWICTAAGKQLPATGIA